MTLLEIKKQAIALIESLKDTITVPDEENQTDLTDDVDIEKKLNGVANAIQIELAQIKRISTKETYTVTEETLEQDLPSDFYMMKRLATNYETYSNKVVFKEAGTYDMFYYKYPTVINDETGDDYELEIDLDCQIIMPYGIVTDVMKGDPSDIYKDYRDRYNDFKNNLRLNKSDPQVYIDENYIYR